MLDQLDCFQMSHIISIDLFMTWSSEVKLLINLDSNLYRRIALKRIILHYIAKTLTIQGYLVAEAGRDITDFVFVTYACI